MKKKKKKEKVKKRISSRIHRRRRRIVCVRVHNSLSLTFVLMMDPSNLLLHTPPPPPMIVEDWSYLCVFTTCCSRSPLRRCGYIQTNNPQCTYGAADPRSLLHAV
jgi:hypothetical protein